ncbi:MAG: (d)CMP kinase [Bryobacteraceae bacterium]
MTDRVVVAIDGPAGAGKSTVARRTAGALGFTYIDTGAMYRAVALLALRSGTDLSDAPRLEELARNARIGFEPGTSRVLLDGENVSAAIRAPELSSAASKVSVFSGVRRELVEKQRRTAETQDVVMEGRDIGSVVFPNAQVKIYLDADPAVRAGRRARELAAQGVACEVGEIERDIRERDRRDSTRSDSPLVRAPGCIYIDTSSLDADQVVQAILAVVQERARE